jgi:hypothetical protein
MWFPRQTPADPARNLAAGVHDPLSLPATKVTGHHRISMIRRDDSTCAEPPGTRDNQACRAPPGSLNQCHPARLLVRADSITEIQ